MARTRRCARTVATEHYTRRALYRSMEDCDMQWHVGEDTREYTQVVVKLGSQSSTLIHASSTHVSRRSAAVRHVPPSLLNYHDPIILSTTQDSGLRAGSRLNPKTLFYFTWHVY
jgi:hypothetical protein